MLTTCNLAEKLGITPKHIYSMLSKTGGFRGFVPEKNIKGRLLWADESIHAKMSERIYDYEGIPLKSGEVGKRLRTVHYLYCIVNQCDICGLISSKNKVRNRDDVFSWNFENKKDWWTEPKNMLCMGCWNKVKALQKRQQESEGLRRYINKLHRTIKNEYKQINQNNGST